MNEQDKYYILVNGELEEVSKEIYNELCKMNRRTKYENERDHQHGLMSYDTIEHEKTAICSASSSLEDLFAEQETCEMLYKCFQWLTWQERELINALYFEKISEREYARRIGLSHTGVQKRRMKTLAKIRFFINILGSFSE